MLDLTAWEQWGCHSLMPQVRPVAKLKIYSQQALAHRAHVYATCIYTASHMRSTDRHTKHSNTHSTSDLILLHSLAEQDESPLLRICIHIQVCRRHLFSLSPVSPVTGTQTRTPPHSPSPAAGTQTLTCSVCSTTDTQTPIACGLTPDVVLKLPIYTHAHPTETPSSAKVMRNGAPWKDRTDCTDQACLTWPDKHINQPPIYVWPVFFVPLTSLFSHNYSSLNHLNPSMKIFFRYTPKK